MSVRPYAPGPNDRITDPKTGLQTDIQRNWTNYLSQQTLPGSSGYLLSSTGTAFLWIPSSSLTNLNASALASGTVDSARLPTITQTTCLLMASPSPAGATYYLGAGLFGTEAAMSFPSPVTGTIRALYVALSGAPGAGELFTYTLRVAGADTSLTFSITDANTSGNDTTHSASVTAGQLISLKVALSAAAATVSHKVAFRVTT